MTWSQAAPAPPAGPQGGWWPRPCPCPCPHHPPDPQWGNVGLGGAKPEPSAGAGVGSPPRQVPIAVRQCGNTKVQTSVGLFIIFFKSSFPHRTCEGNPPFSKGLAAETSCRTIALPGVSWGVSRPPRLLGVCGSPMPHAWGPGWAPYLPP